MLNGYDKSLGSLLSATSITNQKLSENNGKLDSMNGKLDITNNKLEDIKKGLNPQTSSDNNTLDSSFLNASKFLGDVKTSLNGVETKFIDTKKLIDSGFKYTPPSVGTCVDPSTVIHGKQVILTICEPMQKFSSVFYLVFTFMFLYLSIRIFILGFRI